MFGESVRVVKKSILPDLKAQSDRQYSALWQTLFSERHGGFWSRIHFADAKIQVLVITW